MEQTPMAEFLQASMAKIKELVDVSTIVGEPITTDDGLTLIPVSRASFGFGGGGADIVKNRSGFTGGHAAGIKVEPIGFLIIKDGLVRMLNIQPPASNTFDRIVDLIPQLMDKAEEMKDKNAAKKAETVEAAAALEVTETPQG